MTSNDRYSAHFGDISVRGRYNRSSAGHGPTISVFVGDREVITMDFFPDSPQGRHCHERRYLNMKNPVATIVLREVADDGSLLEHVVEHLQERLQSAGESLAADNLTPANSAEVTRYIAAMYYSINGSQN